MDLNEKVQIVDEKVGLKKNDLYGLLMGIVAFIIACFKYETNVRRGGYLYWVEISGLPKFSDGLIALLFVAIIFWRGIIEFSNKKTFGKTITILVDISLFATFFSLIRSAFGNSLNDNSTTILLVISGVLCVTSLLFCQRGISRLIVLVVIAVISFSAMNYLNDAMGFWGFLYVIFVFTSFLLQGNVKLDELRQEFKILYGKTTSTITKTLNDTETEIGKLRDLSKNNNTNTISSTNSEYLKDYNRLIKMKELLDNGIISQEEFDEQKTKLLNYNN